MGTLSTLALTDMKLSAEGLRVVLHALRGSGALRLTNPKPKPNPSPKPNPNPNPNPNLNPHPHPHPNPHPNPNPNPNLRRLDLSNLCSRWTVA